MTSPPASPVPTAHAASMPPPPPPTPIVFAPRPMRIPSILMAAAPSPRTPSPSLRSTQDVLEDFLKLVRGGSPRRQRGSVSGEGMREKGLSAAASPVSRKETRNPIIHNSQFGLGAQGEEA